MNVLGKIKGISYKLLLPSVLKEVDIQDFDINEMPSSCIISDQAHSLAISKWVSPKRTRSYPFERVYNTLHASKKITVIPIVKDEGVDGDRDFIQWDTVSLMSLLDVFVVFAYYEKADKVKGKAGKINNQKFNNSYVLSKIKEIEQYHSSALHWNLNELKENLHTIVDKVKTSYKKIEKMTGVKLHNKKGLEAFKDKIGKDTELFMGFSRKKAINAQSREHQTTQPKESLATQSKAKITINNYLGGQYYFTVDEALITKDKVLLIEGKHSKNSVLPSEGDIKEGLLKMVLYSNLKCVSVNGKKMKSEAVLSLTSPKLVGCINSNQSNLEIDNFISKNNFSMQKSKVIKVLFDEAVANKFTCKIGFLK